jgi:hypothetical protein
MYYRKLVLAVSLVCLASSASAQLTDPRELPKSGNLSTSLKTGSASAGVPEPFGGDDISGERLAPITGSVSRASKDNWTMKVFNNTKDEYSVDLDVIQVDTSGKQVKFDSYSYRLKPGESQQEQISAGIDARDAMLNLRNWRNLSQERRDRDKKENG